MTLDSTSCLLNQDYTVQFTTDNTGQIDLKDFTNIALDNNCSNEDAEITANRKRNKIIFYISSVLVIIFLSTIAVFVTKLIARKLFASKEPQESRTKKVLFVIGDGIPADVIERLSVSNLKMIKEIGSYRRAYVGGENGSYSETPTISAPGYMCLITGTWGNKNNVHNNRVKDPNYNYKNIFRLAKEQQSAKKIGIFSTWIENRLKVIGENLTNAGNITFDYKFDGYELDNVTFPHDPLDIYIQNIDQHVANETEDCLRRWAPDISWVYLQYTDDVGHFHGDSPQFDQSVQFFDERIGQIYNAIEYRTRYFNEDWLFIVTTDHGRDATDGKEHGGQTERERTTWIVTNYPNTNNYFREFQPAIVDILPTMARFINLNIPIETQRELDGVPLIGNVSLIQPNVILMNNNLTITWKTLDQTGNVTVWLATTNSYKDGLVDDYKRIGNVPIENEIISVDVNDYPSNFYKIVLEGQYNIVNRWISRP